MLTTNIYAHSPQPFDLVLDTGSGNLWVFSTPCPLCAPDTPLFDASKSTTFQGTRDSFEIAYGVGDVQGFISTDVVTMGGITIKDQVFSMLFTIIFHYFLASLMTIRHGV